MRFVLVQELEHVVWPDGPTARESECFPMFGAANALQFRLQAQGVAVPYPVFLMLPYAVTIAVLSFAAGRVRAPAGLGQAYQREKR